MTAPVVLAISSEVVFGPVGNSAAVPALQALGIEAMALPTVILSNHPGHGSPVRLPLPASDLAAMLDRLLAGGWLDNIAGLLTGYFSAADQVAVIADRLAEVRRRAPGMTFLCDPILGDDHTGLYVPSVVAAAIRERLLPVADVIAPNRFEIAWLAGLEIHDAASAAAAARRLGVPLTLVTSIPAGEGRLLTMAVSADATEVIGTERRPFVPHGTGDLLSGLFLGHLVKGEPAAPALARAMAALERVLEESAGTPRLDLTALDAVSELHPCP